MSVQEMLAEYTMLLVPVWVAGTIIYYIKKGKADGNRKDR